MLIQRIIIFTLLLVNALRSETGNNATFISPLKIPLSLSANFGELRVDHYHSGLDIKTQGVTGKEVVASASGYVYRISVSPGGFGKAVYIRHPSGYSTVYGHLEKFSSEIDKYVKAQQYEKKSFLVTLFPSKDRFPVNQGDVIAFSGNSGSSGGPHLHYEIRKSEGEIPLNPLDFDFAIPDNIKPVIEKLVIYPINKYTLINNQNKKKFINVTGAEGRYGLPSGTDINISGEAGFGIKSFDQLDRSKNKCAVYSIELQVDSSTLFRYVMDAFSFSESRYINSHIDYEVYEKNKIYIERTFVLPNDKLSVYKKLVNRGIYKFDDNMVHKAEIIVTDVSGNKTVLSFKIKGLKMVPGKINEGNTDDGILMPYNRSNHFESENVRVSLPGGSLYDTLYFRYKKVERSGGMLSDIHCIHNIYTPVNRPYSLLIKPDSVSESLRSKMVLIRLDDDRNRNAVNTTWKDGYLSAEVSSFGNYYAGIDTVGPEISVKGLVQGADLTGRDEIRIRITDDLSGINEYSAEIDGKWALFEYDQKNNVLIYTFDPSRIKSGMKHNLSVKVSDNKNNTSYFNYGFTW